MPSQYAGPDPDRVTEGRAWWKVCCAGCCLGVVVLVVAVPLVVSLVFRHGPQRIETLPESFPSQLRLFRPEEAVEMLYYPAESKGAVASMIETPLLWFRGFTSSSASSTVTEVGAAIGAELRRAEGRDTVAVRWSALNTSQTELLEFYRIALRNAGFAPLKGREDATGEAQQFVSQRANMEFNLLILDDPAVAGLDSVSVVVEYVVPK